MTLNSRVKGLAEDVAKISIDDSGGGLNELVFFFEAEEEHEGQMDDEQTWIITAERKVSAFNSKQVLHVEYVGLSDGLCEDQFDPPTLIQPQLEFSRSENQTLEQLANLPSSAMILLLTPIINPIGNDTNDGYARFHPKIDDHTGRVLGAPFPKGPTPCIPPAEPKNRDSVPTRDPFEVLGRCLSVFHERIDHVPYVPGVGFTDIHDEFVSKADAIITVICETDSGNTPDESMKHQVAFAMKVHDSVINRCSQAITVCRPTEVLIQCASPSHRVDVADAFRNVLESPEYTRAAATKLAKSIFQCRK